MRIKGEASKEVRAEGWFPSAFGQATFYFSADVLRRPRRKKAPDHVGIFVHDAEKEVLRLNGLAAVLRR